MSGGVGGGRFRPPIPIQQLVGINVIKSISMLSPIIYVEYRRVRCYNLKGEGLYFASDLVTVAPAEVSRWYSPGRQRWAIVEV
jgi:hypothetical protein